jgi:hypothetical protein
MKLVAAVLLVLAFFPLGVALRANQRTSLRQALLWTLGAWMAWTSVAWAHVWQPGHEYLALTYGALCLTGCAGVAVLGARRPGVTAWNFVVAGLLAVLLLPILNGLGELRLEPAQEVFLAATLAVPLVNYLPTRLAIGALLLAAGCGTEMARICAKPSQGGMDSLGLMLLAVSPWAAWAGLWRGREGCTKFDSLWLTYRDRFGFAWSQRMREQFNQAIRHAGWPVVLRWQGLEPTAETPPPDSSALLTLLHAVLRRFGPEESGPKSDEALHR